VGADGCVLSANLSQPWVSRVRLRWLRLHIQRGANMAARADHHRDVAAQFRSLAAIEPSDSLRQYLQRIAQRHDELAAGFEHRDPAVTRGILTWASGTRLWPSGWMRPAENN